MIVTKAKVLGFTQDSSIVLLDALHAQDGCRSCPTGCGDKKKVTATFPGAYSSTVALSLSLNDQLVLLLHSLLLPLFGMILGSCIGEWIEASDLVVFSCAMVGLVVGIKCCRPQSLKRVKISEIEDERVNSER